MSHGMFGSSGSDPRCTFAIRVALLHLAASPPLNRRTPSDSARVYSNAASTVASTMSMASPRGWRYGSGVVAASPEPRRRQVPVDLATGSLRR